MGKVPWFYIYRWLGRFQGFSKCVDKRNVLQAHQATNPTIYSAGFTLMFELPPLSISGYNSKYEGMRVSESVML